MQYHYWTMRLFQPLVVQTATMTTAPPAALKETPQEIVRYSQAMFETLLRLYYLRHSYDMYDPWIIHFLLELGTNALNSLYNATPSTTQQSTDHLRSSLVLAVAGLKQQSKSVYIARICALGVQKSMRPADLQWVQTYLRLKPVTAEEQRMIDETTRCAYPVPIVSIDGQLETKQLGKIMRGVEELSVEQQHSTSEVSSEASDEVLKF